MSLARRTIKGRGGGYRRILSTGNFPISIEDKRKLELLKLTREGNDEAQDELILGHVRLAVSIVDRYIVHFNCRYLDDELDDAAIEGIVVAVDRIRQGHLKHDNVTAYIVVVVHRFIADCLWKSSLVRVPRGHHYRWGTPIREDSVNCNPSKMIETRDLIDHVIRSKQERRIVDLRIAGYTDREIGKIMDIPKVTVFRTRQILKTRFERSNRNDRAGNCC